MSSRPIAEDAISQVSKLLASGGLELVDYNIVKADQVGSDVTVQITGTVKLNGNSEKFNDTVMVHGDSGRWRILPPTLDQVSEEGSPSYMVGSFLETILLAKLEQPAAVATQPATKQKGTTANPTAQPPVPSAKQPTPPADPKPGTKPPEPAPRPEPGDRRGPPDRQPPTRPDGSGQDGPRGPRGGFGENGGRPGGMTVFATSGLQVVSIPPPKYTDAAKANKVQGNVLVIATFKADGTVGSPQVIRGLGYGLDEAALDVVKHVKFFPAKVDGKPVDVTRTMRVPFVLPNS
jgi:TonB family protein